MRRTGMTALRLLAALGLALAALVLLPSTSYACSCAQSSTSEHVDRADVVVRGTVEARNAAPRGQLQSSLDPVTYTVAVAEVYKGVAPASLEVRSPVSGASCGLEGVRLGREYVVFANERDHLAGGNAGDELWANLCGGTAAASPGLVAEVENATPVAGHATPEVPTAAPAGLSGEAAPVVAADEPPHQARGLVAVALGAVLLALAVAVWRRSGRRTG